MLILFLASFFLLATRRHLTDAMQSDVNFPAFQRLFCLNPLPEPDWIFGDTQDNWPYIIISTQPGLGTERWSSKNFTSLEDLCSIRGNQRANMGGRVGGPLCR